MRQIWGAVGRALCVAGLLFSPPLSAQPPVEPAATETNPRAARERQAQEAFERGRELMSAGDYGRACPLLEQSLQLDPGLGTQFRLAECYEHVGRLATAWRNYVDVANTARKVGMERREQFARARAAALESRVPRLTIRLAARTPAGSRVTLDEKPIGRDRLSTPLRLDPGPHVVVLTMPGEEPQRYAVELGVGGHTDMGIGPAAPQARAPVERPPSTSEPAQPAGDPSVLERYPWPFVAGGVAVAFAGVGIAFGAHAVDQYDELAKTCAFQPGGCPIADREAVETEALVANVMFAAAGATAMLGAVLIFVVDSTAEESEPAVSNAALQLVPQVGGAALRERF